MKIGSPTGVRLEAHWTLEIPSTQESWKTVSNEVKNYTKRLSSIVSARSETFSNSKSVINNP